MMFGLGSFNLINEFERASNELNVEQLASSSARLQPYMWINLLLFLLMTSWCILRMHRNMNST